LIEHIWTILCSRVITSRETNNVSLIEVMEEVKLDVGVEDDKQSTVESTIPFPFKLVLVSLWSRMEDEKPIVGTARDIFLAPSGEILGNQEFKINLSDHVRMRTMRNFINLPIPVKESGKYRFRTEFLDEENNTWIEVSNIPLIVKTQVR